MISCLSRYLLSIVILLFPVLVSAGGQSWEMRVIQFKQHSNTKATIKVNVLNQSFYKFPRKCTKAVIHIQYHLSSSSTSKNRFTIVAHQYALKILKKNNIQKKVMRIGIMGGSGIQQVSFSSKCMFKTNAAAELVEHGGNKAIYFIYN